MIMNMTSREIFAQTPYFVKGMWEATRGMIGRDFSDFEVMVFEGYGSALHTFFMKKPIDVVFLSREQKVIRTLSQVKPWRPYVSASGAFSFIECPQNYLQSHPLNPGDVLDLGNKTVEEIETNPEFKIEYNTETITSMRRNNG